jgi:hypothetical protein
MNDDSTAKTLCQPAQEFPYATSTPDRTYDGAQSGLGPERRGFVESILNQNYELSSGHAMPVLGHGWELSPQDLQEIDEIGVEIKVVDATYT